MYFNWLPESILERKIVRSDYYEIIWEIEDALTIMDLAIQRDVLILGGDMLDEDFQFNYANWYYNPSADLTCKYNVVQGAEKAKEYLCRYMNRNGKGHYVIIVEDVKFSHLQHWE